jgi:hypothetical protein
MNKFEATSRRYFQAGEGGMHMAEGGDAQGGEGGCTCILCIPPGYAPAHSHEKVPVNFLLQAKRVLVDFRGLESALEEVRVSVAAVRVSVEAVRVSIEALRCL